MKKSANYEVLHIEMKVIVTKKFLLAAGNPMNPEFDEMMTLRTRFAGYTFEERLIEKNPNKQTYGKLTYEYMRDYIRGKETAEKATILLLPVVPNGPDLRLRALLKRLARAFAVGMSAIRFALFLAAAVMRNMLPFRQKWLCLFLMD